MMYASKTPRDLNRDPEPWVIDMGIVLGTIRSEVEWTGDEFADSYRNPRPEYDAVQHNEPNLLLGVARRAHEDGHLSDFIEGFLGDGAMTGHPMIDHARKVLSRLAALAENG